LATAEVRQAGIASMADVKPRVLCAVIFLPSLLAFGYACYGLASLHRYGKHTHAQIGFAIALCGVAAAWVTAESLRFLFRNPAGFSKVPTSEGHAVHASAIGKAESPETPDLEMPNRNANSHPSALAEGSNDNFACPTEVADVLSGWLLPLRAGAELAAILAFMYFCDRTSAIENGKKIYHPHNFWRLWALICIAALFTMRTLKDTKPMQREQTDEWKGWMQIMFVLYHYFKEHEVYNAIRIYIAAYVWMTGYGNQFLYVRGKSFTVRRTLQMLFRLNFMSFCVCVLLNNEYMLYYICGMHTFFTVVVALALYVKNEFNGSKKALYMKVAVTFVMTLLIYDGPEIVFRGLFGTLPIIRSLFAFHDPVHPEFTNEMHEWHFRSGLDRFIWIFGMICALHFPDCEAQLEKLEAMSKYRRAMCKACIVSIGLLALGVWWQYVFSQNKFAYNKLHPYTSFIPIVVYLVFRNLFEPLRQKYLFLFAYLGKYTLETYIMQFHVWMKTTGINGSPKHLLVWIPEGTPYQYWINLAISTAIYIFVSIRFFHVTLVLKDALIPEDKMRLAYTWIGVLGIATFCWMLAYLFMVP